MFSESSMVELNWIVTLLAKAFDFKIFIVSLITFFGAKGFFSNEIFLCSNFERSKMSLTKNKILLALFFYVSNSWFCFLLRLDFFSSSEVVKTADKGVLISWDV